MALKKLCRYNIIKAASFKSLNFSRLDLKEGLGSFRKSAPGSPRRKIKMREWVISYGNDIGSTVFKRLCRGA